MQRRIAFLWIACTAILTWVLNTSFGSIPAIGTFLDPISGFWRNAETKPFNTELTLRSGVREPVSVVFDSLDIPHVFATNDYDLYFAQGYLVARDRLWQMDFSTRAAAGRLSEILGPRALEYDKYQRRTGMTDGAHAFMQAFLTDDAYGAAVAAYADGVNAYILSLKPRDFPIEYKLLGFEPEPWSPLKTAYMVMNLTRTLSFSSSAVSMSNTRNLFGDEFMDHFFPFYPKGTEPIIPADTRWNFTPVPIPIAPDSRPMSSGTSPILPEKDHGIGSNNWAVHGSRTKSGHPILANDPHLDLTLPSIWYLAQLSLPGHSAKGVTFPGVPDVVLGFNEHSAWGATNVGNSALDVYALQLRNDATEYFHDGQWKPTTLKTEVIHVKGEPNVIDSVYYTHHGPIVYREGEKPYERRFETGQAIRWTGFTAEQPFKTFYLINRAKNYDDFKAALAYFDSPPQNLVFADRNGDVAIHLAGQFPLKWKGQGRYVSDGSDPRYDWAGWIPKEHNPFTHNPSRGFVSSANQHSVDPNYPYYLEWDYAPFTRGNVINEELSAVTDVVPDDMRRLQMNTRNRYAELVLDVLLATIDRSQLNPDELAGLDSLSSWSRRNDRDLVGPTIFSKWWSALHSNIWTDVYPEQGYFKRPNDQNTIQLILDDPNSQWLNGDAPFAERVTSTYRTSFEKLDPETMSWWHHLDASVDHILGLDSFGTGRLYASGDKQSVLALNGSNGPSWRLVAELGDSVVARGIYPGGQSGNPGSPRYMNFVADWAEGRLYPLPIMKQGVHPTITFIPN